MHVYYHGAWRLDWGLGNPNKTATLIAGLMIASWAFTLLWRRGFWVALPVFTGLGCCLVQTYSRGGVLALLAGMAVLLVWARRPWSKTRLAAVAVSVCILGFLVFYTKAGQRYGQGLYTDDLSIDSRLVMWRHFPEMLAAAPWGWGWGAAGDSYTQWYQPYDQAENYLNLLNSHLTWMAEGGWIVSIVYIWSWILVLRICWPVPASRLNAMPLALWVSFGISGCFTHVEESLCLWLLPLVALCLVLCERLRLKQWPMFGYLAKSLTLSATAVVGIVLLGAVDTRVPIKAKGGAVTLGLGPEVRVIFVDRNVMGKLFGHTLRRYLEEHPDLLTKNTYIVTEASAYAVSAYPRQVIISGRWLRNAQVASCLKESNQITLINPDCYPQETSWESGMASKTMVYFGEYSQSSSMSSWIGYPAVRSRLINGAGDFVPAWPQAIWGDSGI